MVWVKPSIVLWNSIFNDWILASAAQFLIFIERLSNQSNYLFIHNSRLQFVT